MKILISDTDSGHANGLIPYIETYHPDADITIRVEELNQSITYAIANNIPIICRPTTGLSDARIENEGMNAYYGGVGIVHSHRDESHTYRADPSYVGLICAVGCGDDTPENTGSYGPGLEFFANAANQSNATATITGMIAELMTLRNEWDFHAARQALRQTASNWSYGDPDDGRVDDGGWGLVDFEAAQEAGFLERYLEFWNSRYNEENFCRSIIHCLPVANGDIRDADRWWMLGITFPVETPASANSIMGLERGTFRGITRRIMGRIN